MRFDKKSLLLYAVTDRSWLGEKSLYKQVKDAIDGGITFVQFREKNINEEIFLNEALQIKELCRSHNIPFIINDNVELARKINADGVHVGQNDMKASEVRTVIGNKKILGVSVQTVKQAKLAQLQGADYLGVGAVFPTSSKADADSVTFETLKEICESVSIPVVAIGGINSDNVLRLAKSGISGIAVISAIFAAEDIKKATKELKELTKKVVIE